MKERRKVTKSKAMKIERCFLITKVFLAITPLIAYAYVSMMSAMNGLSIKELLAYDASLTITFIIAMLNPYIAYLLDLVQKKLEEGQFMYAGINLILLMICQLMTLNIFYFMMVAVVFYQVVRIYRIDIKETLKQISIKQTFIMGGGSFIVMSISTVCLFATIQLM